MDLTTSQAPPSKKRKAEAETPKYHIDDDICRAVNISCEAVRDKIKRFLKSGEMKVGELQRAIHSSSASYSSFMRQTGVQGGARSTTYANAFAFFKLRELNGVKIKKRKVEEVGEPAAAAARGTRGGASKSGEDFEGITLGGEEENDVPVYDSCDEIRRKIRAYLAKSRLSQAAFSREVGKMFTPEKKTISGLAAFMAKKGPAAGNTSTAFYGSYVFFEKMRIRDGKPKTEHRLGMEDAWDGLDIYDLWAKRGPGMNVKKIIDHESYIVPASANVEIYQNEFGKPIMLR